MNGGAGRTVSDEENASVANQMGCERGMYEPMRKCGVQECGCTSNVVSAVHEHWNQVMTMLTHYSRVMTELNGDVWWGER